MPENFYGEGPSDLGPIEFPDWQEFMHYLYLPVRIPSVPRADGLGDYGDIAIPDRLAFLWPAIDAAIRDARLGPGAARFDDPYAYVTARRGFATPGNPLNRPGWHCDDFGGHDLNYIWTDRFPTRFLIGDPERPLNIPEDDAHSMVIMDNYAAIAGLSDLCAVKDGPVNRLLGLTPYVIHDTPVIPEPGGMRSFVKISVSTERYNLLGNSHNHLLDYDWEMVDREVLRNQPVGGNRDYAQADQIIGQAGEGGDPARACVEPRTVGYWVHTGSGPCTGTGCFGCTREERTVS